MKSNRLTTSHKLMHTHTADEADVCVASTRTARRRGFTLVELVIVVFIMGILASVATPRIATRFDHYRVKAAAARIASDLDWARQHAKRIGRDQQVIFTLPGSYALPGMDDPDHPSQGYAVDLAQTEYDVTINSVSFDANLDVIFDMYGQPFAGSPLVPLMADGTVTISSGGQSRIVTVNAVTGKVKVQ